MLEHIRVLEKARFSAMMSGNLTALSELLDDDLIYVHSNGLADGKDEYLESLRQGRIAYDEISVIGDHHWQAGGCFVLVQFIHARIRLRVEAEPEDRWLTIMSVWRKGPAGWRLIAMQSTARHDGGASPR
jgi:ketosteroid isomerase-like protein